VVRVGGGNRLTDGVFAGWPALVRFAFLAVALRVALAVNVVVFA
jgi:hypothetical protein